MCRLMLASLTLSDVEASSKNASMRFTNDYERMGRIFTKLSALMHFGTVLRVLGSKGQIQGHHGLNILEHALFGLVKAIS